MTDQIHRRDFLKVAGTQAGLMAVGAKSFYKVEDMKPELEKLAREKLVPEDKNPGKMKKMTVVIEPGVDTTYDDVARTVDTVLAASFEEINFGGGLGARKKKE